MHIYRVSLLDYDNSFDLDLFAQTEEEARSMAFKEEPNMTITRVVCLTSWSYTMALWHLTTPLVYIFITGDILSSMNGRLGYISSNGILV